jgi:hypothetical protein
MSNHSIRMRLTTPREPLDRRRGGKIEFGAPLETSAHTFAARTTEFQKIFGSETFCGVVTWRRD